MIAGQRDWVERALPKLIRIRVVPTRDGHPDADIVIAPMRERWHQ